jgi:hypothetical protein
MIMKLFLEVQFIPLSLLFPIYQQSQEDLLPKIQFWVDFTFLIIYEANNLSVLQSAAVSFVLTTAV